MKRAGCSSCGAPIVWAITASGRRMPLDAQRVDHGTYVLVQRIQTEPLAIAISCLTRGIGAPADNLDVKRYQSHFASCPNADEHRRQR